MVDELPTSFAHKPRTTAIGLLLLVALMAGGCGGGRLITIRTVPADASIVVDGEPRPRGPITERFSFAGGKFHTVLVTRAGYTDKTILIDGSSEQDEVVVQLKPRSRRVRFLVSPLPAIVKVDGKPVSEVAVTQASTELEFAVDSANNWIPHVASAERPGFRRTERVIRFTDTDAVYNLVLEPERKTVTIKTEPPGADVIVDGTNFGPSPVTLEDLVILTDPQTNAWVGRSVKAVKSGLEPATGEISWDDGKTEYLLKLGVLSKTIRLKTDPRNALVKLEGKVLPHRPDGTVVTTLDYPLGGSGELPVYDIEITSPADSSEKYDAETLRVPWDNGKADYFVALTPIPARPPDRPPVAMTRPVSPPATAPATAPVAVGPGPEVKPPVQPPVTRPSSRPATVVTPPTASKGPTLLLPAFRFEKNAWRVEANTSTVPLVKETSEPDGRKPVLVSSADKGMTPDGIVTSPDGMLVAWAILKKKPSPPGQPAQLSSQLFTAETNGNKPPTALTDGQTLDLMPAFSPDGQRLLFTSDRIGQGQFASYETLVGEGGFAVRVAPGETADTELSPTLDSSPRPRLYVEARPSTGGEPRLVTVETVSGKRIDLGHAGTQPRISPRANAVVFVRADPITGNRDIWLLKLGGDEPVNLTNSPTSDDFDPSWSKTGSRIAFASNRPGQGKPEADDVNVWALRVTRPSEITQVTDNEAHDDNPAWSGDDASIYFRSSRGGGWGIWKVELPK